VGGHGHRLADTHELVRQQRKEENDAFLHDVAQKHTEQQQQLKASNITKLNNIITYYLFCLSLASSTV
jgi:hypothetical protein